jgi:hypothetical protein
MGNPYPVHTCTVGPFESYYSNVVSRLTRIVSRNEDCNLSSDKINTIITSENQLTLSAGSVIKDDVLVQIESITIDFTDPSYYYHGSTWDQVGYYYVLLYYAYEKARPAPKPKIQILRPDERIGYSPGGGFVLLKVAKVEIVGIVLTITELFDYDPDDLTIRRIFSSPYLGLECNLPTFNPDRDCGRLILTLNDSTLYYGGASSWFRIPSITWIEDNFTNVDDQLSSLRTFVGSDGPTDTTPFYDSNKVISNGDPLETAISKVDFNVALRSGIAPTSPFAYQIYVDTSTLPGSDAIIYIRNDANTAWIRWGRVNRFTGVLIPDIAGGFEPGVKTVFYMDTAPNGWTILDTLDDKLIYITKGSAAGGQIGGQEYPGGSWTISGVTGDHTLIIDEIPPHHHVSYTWYAAAAGGGGARGRTSWGYPWDTSDTGGGLPHNHPIMSTPGWRPAAYCAIICEKL